MQSPAAHTLMTMTQAAMEPLCHWPHTPSVMTTVTMAMGPTTMQSLLHIPLMATMTMATMTWAVMEGTSTSPTHPHSPLSHGPDNRDDGNGNGITIPCHVHP